MPLPASCSCAAGPWVCTIHTCLSARTTKSNHGGGEGQQAVVRRGTPRDSPGTRHGVPCGAMGSSPALGPLVSGSQSQAEANLFPPSPMLFPPRCHMPDPRAHALLGLFLPWLCTSSGSDSRALGPSWLEAAEPGSSCPPLCPVARTASRPRVDAAVVPGLRLSQAGVFPLPRPCSSQSRQGAEYASATSCGFQLQHLGKWLLGTGVDEVGALGGVKRLPVSTANGGKVVNCYEAFIALPPARGGQLAPGALKVGRKAGPGAWHLPPPCSASG